jgi:hypothetical protein
MEELFDVVYKFLKWLSHTTGFTYREINILTYFYLFPSFLIFLLERITKTHFLKIGFLIIAIISLIFIPDFELFSNHVFDASVVFLKWFQIIGLDYVQSSVLICVFVPIIVIIMLLYFRRKKQRSNEQGF